MKKKYFVTIICLFFLNNLFSQHKKSVYLDYNSYQDNFKIKVPTKDKSSYIERFEIWENGTFVFIYDPLVYKKKIINYEQLKNICFTPLGKLRKLTDRTAKVFLVERINSKFYEIKPICDWGINYYKE